MTEIQHAAEQFDDAPMPLGTRCEIRKQAVIIHVTGELDPVSVAHLDKQLTDVETLVLPPAPLVVNLTGATLSEPGGLAPLVAHARSCARSGRPLLVVAVDPVIRCEIAAAGVADRLVVVNTVAEAMDAA